VPTTELILKIKSSERQWLPDATDPLTAADIVIAPLQDGEILTMTKQGVTKTSETFVGGGGVQEWKLDVSMITKICDVRVCLNKEGYIVVYPTGYPQGVETKLFGFSTAFLSAVEDAQANTGLQTSVLLTVDQVNDPLLSLGNVKVLDPATHLPSSVTARGLQAIGVTPDNHFQYRLDLHWPGGWRHSVLVKIVKDGLLLSPAERQVSLSLKTGDTINGDSKGLALRKVPAGKFQRQAEQDAITTLTRPYLMGETEVTRGLWRAVMGYVPEEDAPLLASGDVPPTHPVTGDPINPDELPVRNVTWIEAVVFCNKLSLAAGKIPVYNVREYHSQGGGTACPGPYDPNYPDDLVHIDVNANGYVPFDHPAVSGNQWATFNSAGKKYGDPSSEWPSGNCWIICSNGQPVTTGNRTRVPAIITVDWNANGYRLPTMQQWRWAAMGADMREARLVNGVNISDWLKPFAGSTGTNTIEDYAWFFENSGGYSVFPVASKLPNELGLYDMTGNVREWCWDPHTNPVANRSLEGGPKGDFGYNDSGSSNTGISSNNPPLMDGGWERLIMGVCATDRITVIGIGAWDSANSTVPDTQNGLRVMRWEY
jgi:formylglycine-generating enzyme required for sulfatase activity